MQIVVKLIFLLDFLVELSSSLLDVRLETGDYMVFLQNDLLLLVEDLLILIKLEFKFSCLLLKLWEWLSRCHAAD